jgi:hypothetical protein
LVASVATAYDMYAHSNDASAKNWATMKKDYPKCWLNPNFHQTAHDKQTHLLLGVRLYT